MASLQEIMQVCRLCLVSDQVNVPIFDGTSDIRETFAKISSCLPVKVSKDDNLPKKICEGCSYKLDLLYDFRNTSVSSEKQLLQWLQQIGVSSGIPTTAVSSGPNATTQTNSDILVKQESFEHNEGAAAATAGGMSAEAQSYIMQQQKLPYRQEFPGFGESSTSTSEPPPKRARRAAAMKAPIAPETDSDEDDLDNDMTITKAESDDDSDEPDQPSYVDATSTSVDDQPGPSGVGKPSVEAKPNRRKSIKKEAVDIDQSDTDQNLPTDQCPKPKKNKRKQSKPVRKIKAERLWPCKRCDQVFVRSTLLRAHRKIHATPKRPEPVTDEVTYVFDASKNLYVCTKCSVEHTDKAEAEVHQIAHKEIFKCPVCEQLFHSAYTYGTHMVTHSDDNIYRCYYCPYTTSKRQSLLVHINYVHLKKFYYTCAKCGKGFNDLIVFQEHENEHLGIRPFVCIVCNKDFPYSKYLRGHQIRYHYVRIEGVLLPNQCSVCNKVFGKAATLNKHFQEDHVKNMLNRERKFLCDLCGKDFIQKDKLKLHYRIHTGEKPFSCSFCAKSFTKKNYLEMHERIHTGEKPYSCQFCSKSFSQKATLNIHMRTHTGERPFACNICGMKFTSKGTLNLHFRNCKGLMFFN